MRLSKDGKTDPTFQQLCGKIGAVLSSDTSENIAIAVSGGGDSMALLDVACHWAKTAGRGISAVTLDHGLRPEAAAEAAMVAEYCENREIDHHILNWAGGKAVGNLAAAGRAARYGLIADWAKKNHISDVLLGHTQDDVAETFLMRLSRKAGVDGLAEMQAKFSRHGIRWVRPFLNVPRAQLRIYLRQRGIAWADDPTNEDLRYDRPKAREALRLLAPLGIDAAALAQVSANLARERDALMAVTQHAFCEYAQVQSGDVLIDLSARPAEIRRRLWLAAIKFISNDYYPPRASALSRMEVGLNEKGIHTLAGCVITKEGQALRFTREVRACAGPMAFDAMSASAIWDGRWQITTCGGKAPRNIGCSDRPLTIKALADGLHKVPDWRATGLPRRTLMASPAIFDDTGLVAAPVAGMPNGFDARIVTEFEKIGDCR